MNRIVALIALLFSLSFFAACPDRPSEDEAPQAESYTAPAPEAITEESALEDADKILKEIDGL